MEEVFLEDIVIVLSETQFNTLVPQKGGEPEQFAVTGRPAATTGKRPGQERRNAMKEYSRTLRGTTRLPASLAQTSQRQSPQPIGKIPPIGGPPQDKELTTLDPSTYTAPAPLTDRFYVVLEDAVIENSFIVTVLKANHNLDDIEHEKDKDYTGMYVIKMQDVDCIVDELYRKAVSKPSDDATYEEILLARSAYLAFMQVSVRLIPWVDTVTLMPTAMVKDEPTYSITDAMIKEYWESRKQEFLRSQDGGRKKQRGGTRDNKTKKTFSWYKRLKQLISGPKVVPGNAGPTRTQVLSLNPTSTVNNALQPPLNPANAVNNAKQPQQGNPITARPGAHLQAQAARQTLTFDQLLTDLCDKQPELGLRLFAEKKVMDYENFLADLAVKEVTDETIPEILRKIHEWKESFKDLHRNPLFLDVLNKVFRTRAHKLSDMADVSKVMMEPFRKVEVEFKRKEVAKTVFEASLKNILNFVNVVRRVVRPTFDVIITRPVESVFMDVHISYDTESICLFFKSFRDKDSYNVEAVETTFPGGVLSEFINGKTAPHKEYPEWKDTEGVFKVMYEYKFSTEYTNSLLSNPTDSFINDHIEKCYSLLDNLQPPPQVEYLIKINNWYGSQGHRIYKAMTTTGTLLMTFAKSLLKFTPQLPSTFLMEKKQVLNEFVQAMNTQLDGNSWHSIRPAHYHVQTQVPFTDQMKLYIDYISSVISTPLPRPYAHVHDYHKIVVCLDDFLKQMVALYDRSHVNYRKFYFNIHRLSLHQILYVRYIGSIMSLQHPDKTEEYTQVEDHFQFLIEHISDHDTPVLPLANATMHFEMIERYQNLYNTTQDENLKAKLLDNLEMFVRLFITEFYFSDESPSRREQLSAIIFSIIHKQVKNADSKLNLSKTVWEQDPTLKGTTPIPFAFTPDYTSNDTVQLFPAISVYDETAYNSYTRLMAWVINDFYRYLDEEYTYKEFFDGIPTNFVEYMIDTKQFVDEFVGLIRDTAFKIAYEVSELKNEGALNGLTFKPLPLYAIVHPRQRGAGGAKYFALKGRRYKVRKEGRKLVIKTKNGVIPLTEAKKLQRQYLKNVKAAKHITA